MGLRKVRGISGFSAKKQEGRRRRQRQEGLSVPCIEKDVILPGLSQKALAEKLQGALLCPF